MTQNGKSREKLIKAWADLEWVWVLVNHMGKNQDSLLVIEMDTGKEGEPKRVVPIFDSREVAQALKPKLFPGQEEKYHEQAMRLGDVGKFAATEKLEIMLLDEDGRIMAHLAAQIEESPLH